MKEPGDKTNMVKEHIKRIPMTAIGAISFHPKRQNISFGRWAMPVMAQKMQQSDALERKRALQSLCDYVYDSRRVASKEFANVVPHLKKLCSDEDDEVRLKATECLAALTATAAGRHTFNKHDFYDVALSLLEDKQEDIRLAINTVLQRISLSPIGADALVEAGATEILIKRISHESDAVLEILLKVLHACCFLDAENALSVDGLEVLTPLLERSSSSIREKAAVVIMDLTVETKGRTQALQLLVPLLNLCLEESETLKAKALAALMMIVNSTQGRYTALENYAIERILPLLRSKNYETRLNAVKVLTCLSEAPEGRKIILENLKAIYQITNDDLVEIQNAGKKLLTVALFNP